MRLIPSQNIARGDWAPLIGFDLLLLGSLFENLVGYRESKGAFFFHIMIGSFDTRISEYASVCIARHLAET